MNKNQFFLAALLEYLKLGYIYINDEIYIGDIKEARKSHKLSYNLFKENSIIELGYFIEQFYKKPINRFEFLSENSIIDKDTNIHYYFTFSYDLKNNINSKTLKELAEEKILDDVENDLDYEYHKYFDFDWYIKDQLKYFDYSELDYKEIEVKWFNILGTEVFITENKDVFEEEKFIVSKNQLKLF
jgi:hypothetical protein